MTGMESLSYEFAGTRHVAPFAPVLVGVVGSGNLEVLVESAVAEVSRYSVETSARGFGDIWEAVLRDFQERHGFHGLRVSINDMGATPAVVSLRLDQAAAGLKEATP
jgi:malonate decarboxylase delta subunit